MKKGETNANPKMQLLRKPNPYKRGLGIPTLPNTTEVLCTMPKMQAHKQLLYKALACTRYHRPNRERTKQKTEMVKLTEAKKVLLKDLVEQARKEYGWPNLRHSPKERRNQENPRHLLERTTRSRQTTKTGRRRIKHKPLLPK